MRVAELRCRDVVNLADGKRLGLVSDVELDVEAGRVTALLVPGTSKRLGIFGAESDHVIPWSDVVTIGEDVVLVRWSAPDPVRPERRRARNVAP